MLMVTMSKALSQLVGVQEQLFGLMINQLESASGYPTVDIRLTSEMITKIFTHLRALGLDPVDTKGEELYGALLGLVGLHDRFLAHRMGASNSGDVADLLPRIKKLVDMIDIPKSVWVMKHSVAKKLLKASPPKQVMKQLGYRSIDSMLKRESIDELFVGIRLVETQQWQKNFIQKYQKIEPSDFETRQAIFLLLDGKKWGSRADTYVQKQHQNVTHLKELGVIAILPLPVSYLNGITIALLPRLLFYLNEVRTYSTYFKHHQVKSGFGQILARTLIDDPARHVTLAGQHVHWRVVHQYYGSEITTERPDFFEPHIQPEDLFWRKAEEVLYKIEPALHFWHTMDYVGLAQEAGPVSFNLMDVAANYINKTPYDQRFYGHMRDSLWNELFMRYLANSSLRTQLHLQINHQTPESVML